MERLRRLVLVVSTAPFEARFVWMTRLLEMGPPPTITIQSTMQADDAS
jgi:hypothetical protein